MIYNDTIDPSEQIDTEERIAGILYDRAELSEELSADLSRLILQIALRTFRPDVFTRRPTRKHREWRS